MGLLAPLALAFLPILALITVLYLLRLRRPETAVSSLYLWRAMLRDQEANAPWQRLSASFLLLLQLAIAAALILALARPWATATTPGGRNLVLVVDTSASMGATDGPGGRTRLQEAARLAWERVATLPANGSATILAASNHVRVVAPATADRDVLHHALDALRPDPAPTDLAEALSVAAGLVASLPDPEVLIYSDGRFPDPRDQVPALAAPIHFVPVGTRGANQAIVALSLGRTAATLHLFAQVANAAPVTVTRRLDVDLDGVAWAGRTLILPPGQTTAVTLDEVPPGTGVVHAHLAGTDDLAVDDEAWTVNRLEEPAPVLLVSAGNRFLQNALVLLPNVSLTQSAPEEYAPSLTATLTVFDRVVPSTTLPAGNLLFLAPPTSTVLFDVTGVLTDPAPLLQGAAPGGTGAGTGAAGGGELDALLRYADLSDLHIGSAVRLSRPAWAHVVLDGEGGPLILAGETAGRRVVVLSFDLHNSDLPLQMAFPLLMRNMVGYLLPAAAGGLPPSVAPGATVPLVADVQNGVDHVTVSGPDGALIASYTVQPDRYRFDFGQTAALGLYVVSQWAGRQELRREGFTVNLFSVEEARTAPRRTPALPATHLARAAAAPLAEPPRLEWWQIPAILALLALVGEWLATHRLGLRRFGQQLGAWRGGGSVGHPRVQG
ncbi:MAG TPA: VWA domain-containing protein [Chloroflexia bacterium]|nr:VWA domain-containing protein [Chloroflexia bacterium]